MSGRYNSSFRRLIWRRSDLSGMERWRSRRIIHEQRRSNAEYDNIYGSSRRPGVSNTYTDHSRRLMWNDLKQ
jgi:hypothetical protein